MFAKEKRPTDKLPSLDEGKTEKRKGETKEKDRPLHCHAPWPLNQTLLADAAADFVTEGG